MPDEKDSAYSPLISFMNKKSTQKSEGGTFKGISKTKENLEKARQKQKEEEEKKLTEAKKESRYKASRYNQSYVTKRRAKETGLLYIAAGVITTLILLAIVKIVPLLGTGMRGLLTKMFRVG